MAFSLKNRHGATLTEILIVVAIIAILILISFWYYYTQVFKGRDAKRKADIKRIQIAIEEYEKDNNCYPPSLVACGVPTKDQTPDFEAYIDRFPCDPITNASYTYYADPDNPSCPSWYWLFASLDNEKDKDIEDLGCTEGCGPNLAYNYYATSPNAPEPAKGTGGGGGGGGAPAQFYGCFSGSCLPISWDPERPGPECDPNYGNSTCYDQCTDPVTGEPQNECEPWNQ